MSLIASALDQVAPVGAISAGVGGVLVFARVLVKQVGVQQGSWEQIVKAAGNRANDCERELAIVREASARAETRAEGAEVRATAAEAKAGTLSLELVEVRRQFDELRREMTDKWLGRDTP